MKLPGLESFDFASKKVLLRADLDVPLVRKEGRWQVKDDTRLKSLLPTLDYLLKKGADVLILGHLGRPEGRFDGDLSLGPVAQRLSEVLKREVPLISDFNQATGGLAVFENLRFWKGEEESEPDFIQNLAKLGEIYVNDAFAASHREHASIVGLPKVLPHAAGFSLEREVATLSQIIENPKRPVVVILGGAKEDKLESIPGLIDWVDLILIGGKLASLTKAKELADHHELVASLTKTGEDITIDSAREFIKEVGQAGTIIWTGPLGKVEDPRFQAGTKIFAQAMVGSEAFKVIGGGDTEAILDKMGLIDKMDFVSTGGGAMLEFLASGDLPGLKALRD